MSKANCRCRGGCRCTPSLTRLAWDTKETWIVAIILIVVLVWPWYVVALVVDEMHGIHHLWGGLATMAWWIYLLTLGTRGMGLGKPKHRRVKRGKHRAS